MREEQLQEKLAELHRELETGPEISPETRRLLAAVLNDIRQMLARPTAAGRAPEHDSLVERLRSATWDLEASHPRLATAASQLIDAMTRPFQ